MLFLCVEEVAFKAFYVGIIIYDFDFYHLRSSEHFSEGLRIYTQLHLLRRYLFSDAECAQSVSGVAV